MLKSSRVGEVGLVAHKIFETAQSPNGSFPFLFDFGLGFGIWDLGLSILELEHNVIFYSFSMRAANAQSIKLLLLSSSSKPNKKHLVLKINTYNKPDGLCLVIQ